MPKAVPDLKRRVQYLTLAGLFLLAPAASCSASDARNPSVISEPPASATYLNPDIGRFWTADSFEGIRSDPLSLHKYVYCHANPVNHRDPSGLFFDSISTLFASGEAIGTRGGYEGSKAKISANAITAALLITAGIVAVETVPDIIKQIKKEQKIPYFRYDRFPGLISFAAGTDVTSRGNLTWSEAIAITWSYSIDTLYMYTLLTRPGDVGFHPDGPFVGNVPQFKLERTVSAPDVILTRILQKGDEW